MLTGSEDAPLAILGWSVSGPVGHTGLNAVVGCTMDSGLPLREDVQLEVQVRPFWELATEAERAKHNEDP